MQDLGIGFWLIIAAGVGAFLFMQAKHKAKRGLGPLAESKKGWYIEHSKGMPERPNMVGQGWNVDLPIGNPTDPETNHLNAIKNYSIPKLSPGMTCTLRGRVEGNLSGNDVTPVDPASAGNLARVTLVVQRKGDPLSGRGQYEYYRHYSSQTIPLVDGPFEVTFPLTSEAMRSIMSKRDPALFAECLADAANVHLGFGAAGGAAHGVVATSPVRFHLYSMTFGT